MEKLPLAEKSATENKENETLELKKRQEEWFNNGMISMGVASGVAVIEAIIMAKIGMPPEIAIPAFSASSLGAFMFMKQIMGRSKQ